MIQYQLLLDFQWDGGQISLHIPVSWVLSNFSLNPYNAGLALNVSGKNTFCLPDRPVPSTLPMCDEYLVMILVQPRGKNKGCNQQRGEYLALRELSC